MIRRIAQVAEKARHGTMAGLFNSIFATTIAHKQS